MGVGCESPYKHGPFTHDLNKGGLGAILAEKQLISTPDWQGVDGVRARRIPLEQVSVYREAVIEFCTKEPPTSQHPRNHEVQWSIVAGERLDISITRVKYADGTIATP